MAGQLWGTASIGGNYAALNLSKELRMGVQAMGKWRQFCDVKDAWDKVTRTGQTFTWDVIPMMSRANRVLQETNTIPQGQHTILQSTLTVSERGFSVPYTGLVESLAMVSVRAPIMKALKYDAMCDLEVTAYTQFNATPTRVVSTSSADTAFSLTTNSTATLTNTTLISKINTRAIVDGMRGRNVPYFTGSYYYAIGRPAALTLLKADIETVHQYTDTGLTMIMNGEVGRYWNTKIVEQTVVPRGGAADSTTFDAYTDTADAWNGSAGDWVFFFGEDTVCEAIHTPEEIRLKLQTDYERSKGVAWYALVGYGITHTNEVQSRIFKYDSAV